MYLIPGVKIQKSLIKFLENKISIAESGYATTKTKKGKEKLDSYIGGIKSVIFDIKVMNVHLLEGEILSWK